MFCVLVRRKKTFNFFVSERNDDIERRGEERERERRWERRGDGRRG